MLIYAQKLILFFIFSFASSSYYVENAFPALSFTDPVGIYDANDGTNRLFVVEQTGKIKVFDNDSSVGNSQIFLDIESIVEQDGGYTEEGLLGLAFHPNFSENGYFYVNFNASALALSPLCRILLTTIIFHILYW